jgi:hypothetical protein
MDKIVGFLGYSGSYAAARELSRHVASARQQALGAERPSTLTARANLARWTSQADDDAGNRQLRGRQPKARPNGQRG